MKKILLTSAIIWTCSHLMAQLNSITSDKEWTSRQVVLKNTIEAEYIVRIGDVDNLGFGWPEAFDPFCGLMTEAHAYPWDADPNEMPGFDKILLSSKYKTGEYYPCGGDGYAENWRQGKNKPVPYIIPTKELTGANIRNASLQLFIDDFQARVFCSQYQISINGKRFVEAEKMLNLIEQTGPVGKLISIPIPEEFYPDILSGNDLKIDLDEVRGVPDGFAIDFIRLVINRLRDDACIGVLNGRVLEKDTELPIAGASVNLPGVGSVQSNAEGDFMFPKVPSGYVILAASAKGYADGGNGADVGPGDANPLAFIYLEKGNKKASFGGAELKAGESITLNNILFDQGKAELKPESLIELDKIVAFLKANPEVEIELSGHTSSEGDAAVNRSLSYKRVNACKTYVVGKGIDSGRIIAKGFGPDKPVAPNDTEVNRAKNRRAEMRILKL